MFLVISCKDYPLAIYLNVIQKILNLIHFVVPFILVVMLTVQIIKLVTNPNDNSNKMKKGILYEFLAALLIFLLPWIVGIVINLIPDSFDLPTCWNEAQAIGDVRQG